MYSFICNVVSGYELCFQERGKEEELQGKRNEKY